MGALKKFGDKYVLETATPHKTLNTRVFLIGVNTIENTKLELPKSTLVFDFGSLIPGFDTFLRAEKSKTLFLCIKTNEAKCISVKESKIMKCIVNIVIIQNATIKIPL